MNLTDITDITNITNITNITDTYPTEHDINKTRMQWLTTDEYKLLLEIQYSNMELNKYE